MKILFLGNCQIYAMRALSQESFPKQPVQFQTITPFWGKFDEDLTRAQLADADLVVSQAIANPETTFNVADVRSATKGDVVFLPYVYLDGIASLELIGSKGKPVIKGGEQLLAGQEGRTPDKIYQDYCDGRIDMMGVARVEASLARMAEKEATDCDIAISDYVADTWRKQPTVFGINHPTQPILFEMYRRFCAHVGWKYDASLAENPVTWGKRALPLNERALTPNDVKSLGLDYPCDSHWYGRGYKLLKLAIKAREDAQIDGPSARPT